MLANEIYIGNMVQGKYGSISYKTKKNTPRPREKWFIVEGTHEPIIEKELWDRVQKLYTENAKPYKSGNTGLFARKAYCMYCGGRMASLKESHTGRRYLSCLNRKFSKSFCTGSFISVERLEKIVLDKLKQMYKDLIDEKAPNKNIHFVDNLQQQKEDILKEIKLYEKKISEYSKATRDLYLDKSKGLISEPDYRAFSRDFVSGKERLANLVNGLEEKLVLINEKNFKKIDREKIITKYANIDKLNHEIVQELIDHICVGKRKLGTKNHLWRYFGIFMEFLKVYISKYLKKSYVYTVLPKGANI